ncbi:MAG: GNAT family N-acetyltransferase [Saonia sp.]
MDYLLEGEETDRLLFRKLVPSDFDAWLPFHQEPLSTQHWSGGHPDPKTACQQDFDRTFERYENNLGGKQVVLDKKTNTLVGLCGLLVQTVDTIQELEIGYSILPKYWKRGYATEAAKKCKEFAFANKLSTSLISIIQVDNIGSQKVAIANGMHLDKTITFRNNPVHIFRVHVTYP